MLLVIHLIMISIPKVPIILVNGALLDYSPFSTSFINFFLRPLNALFASVHQDSFEDIPLFVMNIHII